MLAMAPDTLIGAVQSAKEFLQVLRLDSMSRPTALAVEGSDMDKGASDVEASLASISKVWEAQSAPSGQGRGSQEWSGGSLQQTAPCLLYLQRASPEASLP